MVLDPSFTISDFCAAEKISRSMFYKLKKQNKAPRTYHVGTTTRISYDARQEWRRALEAETSADEAIKAK